MHGNQLILCEVPVLKKEFCLITELFTELFGVEVRLEIGQAAKRME